MQACKYRCALRCRQPMEPPPQTQVIRLPFDGGAPAPAPRTLAEETPIAFEYNGLGYAVMMATPRDLTDFAAGFTLAEGLVEDGNAISDIAEAEVEGGRVLRIAIPETSMSPLRERLRLRLVEGNCGLCGLESIEQVLRPLPRLDSRPRISANGVAKALEALGAHQPLGLATGAMHAAAFCAPDGTILAAREDVGRHNALDKLTGHLARSGIDPATGFILLSARCSYELVEKTVRAGCPALVTISAPSDLAVERARAARLTLLALARSDSALVPSDPHGLFA